jgi:hypothetical protein
MKAVFSGHSAAVVLFTRERSSQGLLFTLLLFLLFLLLLLLLLLLLG